MDNTTNFPPPFFEYGNLQNETPIPDPDNPSWSALAGIGVWFASIAALVLASLLGAALYILIYKMQGGVFPNDPDEMSKVLSEVLMRPTSILIQIIFTILGHVLTIAMCWAVATGLGKRSLKESIGWNWDEPSMMKKVGIVILTVVASIALFQVTPLFLPDSKKTPFSDMLQASQSVRYVVAFLAVFTAPLVEEFVYRGLLYSPLKRALGTVGAVSIATILFALVHVPQYWGAWASLVGLLLLSLGLTVVRATTKSILPCVAIHTVFNAIGAIGILLGHDS